MDEGLKSIEEQDNGKGKDADPRHVWLEPSPEIEILSVNALNLKGAMKPDEADADGDPCDQATKGYRCNCQTVSPFGMKDTQRVTYPTGWRAR